MAPGLMGAFLGHYGRHLFECGKALYYFRHLVVYAQRTHPSLKGQLQPAWNIIQRWEELEPVSHRRPIPFSMMQALVALSLLWEWPRVAAVILLSFYGCCRPGKVLKAQRGHLVLPRDLSKTEGPCFLRICKPKPGRRGVGRVQRAKLSNTVVIDFLDSVFGERFSEEKLYPGSPGAFRTRWNKLLIALKIPASDELTPAGLRAGGTVQLCCEPVPIQHFMEAPFKEC